MLISLSEIEEFGTGANQSVGILCLTGSDVLTILPTGYDRKRVEFIKVFLAKLFASNPNASMSMFSWLTNTRSTASPENNSKKNEMTELGLSPVHLIELDFHLKRSAAIGKHVTTVE